MSFAVGSIVAFNRDYDPYQMLRNYSQFVEYSPSDKEQYIITGIYNNQYMFVESLLYPNKIIGWILYYMNDKFYFKKDMYQSEAEELDMIQMTDTQMDYIPYEEDYENEEPEVTSAYREYYPIHDVDV